MYTGAIIIKCLFWNLNKKNLVQELIEMVIESNIDILMTVEAENLDIQYFLSGLRKNGRSYEKKEILPKGRSIILLADTDITVSIYREEKYFVAYKVRNQGKNRLLIVVHLTSAMRRSEYARNQRANDISKTIEIIVGDFNLHPFSAGIIGMHGFNAIMDSDRALKESRKLNNSTIKFYYNPMWNLMGKQGHALGTYYFESDQDDNSFYWYTFDQILIRPELIVDFIWDEFEIVDHIGNDSLIKNNKIYNKKYSDHLPVKFSIT